MLPVQAAKFIRLFRKANGLKITLKSELDFFKGCAQGLAECKAEDASLFIEVQDEYRKALKEARIEVMPETTND